MKIGAILEGNGRVPCRAMLFFYFPSSSPHSQSAGKQVVAGLPAGLPKCEEEWVCYTDSKAEQRWGCMAPPCIRFEF